MKLNFLKDNVEMMSKKKFKKQKKISHKFFNLIYSWGRNYKLLLIVVFDELD